MNRVNVGSNNGLSPIRCQAITWTNVGLLSIGLLGTNFSEIQIGTSFTKMRLKCRLPKWRPFCPEVRWVKPHGSVSAIANICFIDCHDDVIKWKHFPRYWPFVLGIHRWPVNSTHKGQLRRALMFSLICAWINGWVNNREAGDLRRHQAHYDVTVKLFVISGLNCDEWAVYLCW